MIWSFRETLPDHDCHNGHGLVMAPPLNQTRRSFLVRGNPT